MWCNMLYLDFVILDVSDNLGGTTMNGILQLMGMWKPLFLNG